MDFRIADTFTGSLARLTNDEQKLVKTTAFNLQMNPANPGHQFHKLDKAKDRNFWSVRVGSDIRLIVHKTASGLLLCYVDHHDNAYRWAERRKIERHPSTGAAQLVEVRVNYRTSHQIRRQADRLLPDVVSDVDGIAEERNRTISIFNGPDPAIQIVRDAEAEVTTVAAWLNRLEGDGIQPHEIGVFVRGAEQLPRAQTAVEAAGMRGWGLDGKRSAEVGEVTIGTMHMAKGLEYKAVVVMACDDEIIPSQARIESVADEADLSEVYESERHLLYVACTRARDRLLVTAVAPGSEFLDDLRSESRR